MTYPQTEQIILEQLEAGNYSLSHVQDWAVYSLILSIPKSSKVWKIKIEFQAYYWDKSDCVYSPWGPSHGRVNTVTLGNWWNSQQINLRNENLKQRLAEVCAEYWSGQTVERRLAIAKEDAAWAEKFRKVLK